MYYVQMSRILLCLLSCLLFTRAQVNKPSKSRHGTLTFSYQPNITRVTIDHPPINLFDRLMGSDFFDFLVSIQPSSGTIPPKVVIFDSADPDFFIPHVDLSAVVLPISDQNRQFFGQVRDVVSFLRNTTSTVFIAEVDGRTSGFGDEIFLQSDLRYVGPGGRFSQLETALGSFPGGGGTQALPRLINRGRALQYILSGEAVQGPLGKELGWFNEYYNDTATLKSEVEKVAKRIALYPAGGLNATKAVLSALYPPQERFDQDFDIFSQVTFGLGSQESQKLLKKALVLSKNQTRSPWELGLPDTLIEVYE